MDGVRGVSDYKLVELYRSEILLNVTLSSRYRVSDMIESHQCSNIDVDINLTKLDSCLVVSLESNNKSKLISSTKFLVKRFKTLSDVNIIEV